MATVRNEDCIDIAGLIFPSHLVARFFRSYEIVILMSDPNWCEMEPANMHFDPDFLTITF
jgi:hypothetical protein